MPFTQFTTFDEVRKTYRLETSATDLFTELVRQDVPDWLAKYLSQGFRLRKIDSSEIYAREFFIAPVLAAALEPFPHLNLFSSEYRFQIDDALSGSPDYIVSWMRNPGQVDNKDQRPLLAVAETKKEIFSAGWAQCAAQMVAAQKVNDSLASPVWGIVSSGLNWEFGCLKGATLFRHLYNYNLQPLESLLSALHFVLADCEKNGAAFASSIS